MPDLKKILPSQLMQSVLGKLYQTLTQGDGEVAPVSEDNFLSWCSPGIPITSGELEFLTKGITGVVKEGSLKKDDKGNTIPLTETEKKQLRASHTAQLYMQAENLARLVDFIPDVNAGINGAGGKTGLASLSIKQDEGTLSDVYKYALTFSRVAASELSDADKQKIEKFKQLLQVKRIKKDLITEEETEVLEPSPLVVLYNQKMNIWADAVIEYHKYRVDAATADDPSAVHFWQMNAKALSKKVKAAYMDWVANGYKNEFEGITAKIDQLMSKDLSLLKESYKEALEQASLRGIASGSDFYYTSLVPGDFINGGWTGFKFSAADFETHQSSDYTSYGAQAAGSFMGFNASGGFKHSDGSSEQTFDATNFRLEFEMCQVQIVRPWLKTPFLTSKAWKLDPANAEVKSRGEMLNDGKTPPTGILPGYPTSIIFIRNLVLDFGEASAQMNSEFESNAGGGSAGWGPFSVSANYEHNDSNRSMKSKSSTQGIEVNGMQIIGFNCHVLPKSPDPLPEITNWE